MLTVARSPAAAVVAAVVAAMVIVASAFALLEVVLSTISKVALKVEVLDPSPKVKPPPATADAVVVKVSPPRTPRRAMRIEIKISRFFEEGIVTAVSTQP
jgi:hypothetical protein